MKIIAEFNSIREVLDFINTFGTKVIENQVTIDDSGVGKVVNISMNQETNKGEEKSNPTKEGTNIGKVKESSNIEENVQSKDITEDKKGEEVRVTKEQVRGIFTKLVKAGKQKEAKELTAKYGASKVVEINEDDYAAILKEAEELL